MIKIMMALGAYHFSLSTAAYQSLERVSSYRWQKQDRLGRKPALQYVGPDADTVEFEGVIHPYFRGGLGQLTAMRTEAGKGKPLILVDGLGKTWGKYCIKRISETQTIFTDDGIPKKIEFRLSLEEYGEDAA